MQHKIFITTLFFLISHFFLSAQPVYFTRSGHIQFFSQTPLEDIKANNKKVYSSLNTQTGALQFLLKVSQFQFKYSAMRDHFNDEDYMDSQKFPTAEFKGKITDLSSINFTVNGTYSASIEGSLTMHGVAKTIRTTASFQVNNNQITGVATFPVKLEDYDIKVPKIVFKKIAETVNVTVNCIYAPYKK